MGYVIVYRRSPADRVEYWYELERHLAGFTAQAVILEDYELVDVRSGPGSHPLTSAEVFAHEQAKTVWRVAYGKNLYANEEDFALSRFRTTYCSNFIA